jgi:hypothetical protein
MKTVLVEISYKLAILQVDGGGSKDDPLVLDSTSSEGSQELAATVDGFAVARRRQRKLLQVRCFLILRTRATYSY